MYNYRAVIDYKKSDEDDIYREQICLVFGVDQYDHEVIIDGIRSIHSEYSRNESFVDLIKFAKIKFQEDESIYAFMYLFSWDYFELVHICLNDLNNTQIIAPENISCIRNYEK
jgi:hypothetical protein